MRPGNWLIPDIEGNGGGTFRPGWKEVPGGQEGGMPKPSGHPTPAPPSVEIDKRTVIAALARAASYQPPGQGEMLSTEGLTNESVEQYFDERLPKWIEVLETEGLIKPYQIWIGGVVRAGVFKVNPQYFFWVPDTGRVGVGGKMSVSGSTNMLKSGAPTAVCAGIEMGYSPAVADGFSASADMAYNINFKYGNFSYVPDKGFSVSLEFCMDKSKPGASIGVRATRGFSETLNRPRKPEPQKQTPFKQLKTPP